MRQEEFGAIQLDTGAVMQDSHRGFLIILGHIKHVDLMERNNYCALKNQTQSESCSLLLDIINDPRLCQCLISLTYWLVDFTLARNSTITLTASHLAINHIVC